MRKNVNEYPNTKEWTQEQRLKFFEANQRIIYASVRHFQGRSDRHKIDYDDDDLYQEASLVFWLAFDSYDPNKGASFCTYLRTLMDNALTDIMRKQNSLKRRIDATAVSYEAVHQDSEDSHDFSGEDLIPIGLVPITETIEDQCIKNNLMNIIYDILDTGFTEAEKKIFLSVGYQGKTQKATAEELHFSQGKVSMIYKTVKSRVKQCLLDLGYEFGDF